jgi:AcrR family transcriptional regulator
MPGTGGGQRTRDRTAGRPRDPAADDAILSATLAILAEHGYTGLTMDHVADRAGVSKATIYRRWSSKDEVLVAAVDRLSRTVAAPDTGDLRGDLTAIVDGLARVFSSPQVARLTGAIVAQVTLDPDLADAVRSGFLADRRTAAVEALERARRRGQTRPRRWRRGRRPVSLDRARRPPERRRGAGAGDSPNRAAGR